MSVFGEGILSPHCYEAPSVICINGNIPGAQAAGRGDGRDRHRSGASHSLRAGN